MAHPNHPPKTPEAAARERAHQFGQKDGNPIFNINEAQNIRHFFAWVLNKATQEELTAYYADKSNPALRRSFVKRVMDESSLQDIYSCVNQAHGLPKQEVAVNPLPDLHITIAPIEPTTDAD